MGQAAQQARFESEFRAQIERRTPALVAALRVIASTSPPPVVKILAFEIQADWRRFPVHAFAMDDESPDEVYFEPPFYGPLLPESGELIPREVIDQEGYENAGVATVETGARVLAEWVGECWNRAGGASFELPAYVNLHDSSSYYDLRARRWVADVDIWP